MTRIRLGQIGIGHNHGAAKMEAARKRPDLFEIIGYAEENEVWVSRRGELQAYSGLPRLSEEEILEKSDAVLVECDVWDLTDKALKCAAAGKHMHLDKPLSGSLASCRKLLGTAGKKRLTVQMGYMYRYNPAIRELLTRIRDGQLGEIYSVNAEMSTCHLPEYRRWLTNFRGGIMYILGSHLLDLILYILGEPEAVHPFLKHSGLEGIDYEDNNLAVLEYKNALARIFVSSVEINGFGRRQFVVSGSGGTASICPIERPTVMTWSDRAIAREVYEDRKILLPVTDLTAGERYDAMLQDFHDYITGEKTNPFSYAHDYTVAKVLSEICGGEGALKPGVTAAPGYDIRP